MFNEKSLQEQLQNFQQQSLHQHQQQRLQFEQLSQCGIPKQQVTSQFPVQPGQCSARPPQVQQVAYPRLLPSNDMMPEPVRWPECSKINQVSSSHFSSIPKMFASSLQQNSTSARSSGNKVRSIILPKWLTEAISNKPLRCNSDDTGHINISRATQEVYSRALGLVECTSLLPGAGSMISNGDSSLSSSIDCSGRKVTEEWVDTNRVSLLLLRTGVSAGVLAVLWELVNCTKVGQLTRNECAGLLALIAMVQSGQNLVSADVLQNLPEPIVPVIDHPALLPHLQHFKQLSETKVIHLKNQNAPDDEFSDFVGPLSPIKETMNVTPTNLPYDCHLHTTGNTHSLALPTVVNHSFHPQFPPSVQPMFEHSGSNHPINDVAQKSLDAVTSINSSAAGHMLDKCMNLPKVGFSPDMSPTLSFDNSQEDDFDDFQSATSDPPGQLSSEGSPRSATNTTQQSPVVRQAAVPAREMLLGSAVRVEASVTSTKGAKVSSVAGFQKPEHTSDFKNLTDFNTQKNETVFNGQDTKLSGPSVLTTILQPNKLTMATDGSDRYAALRGVNFDDSTNIETDQLNSYNRSQKDNMEAEELVGQFSSAVHSIHQVDEDDFGDFTAAGNDSSTSVTDSVFRSIKSMPSLQTTSFKETKSNDFSFIAPFIADFSSLNTKENSSPDLYHTSIVTNPLPDLISQKSFENNSSDQQKSDNSEIHSFFAKPKSRSNSSKTIPAHDDLHTGIADNTVSNNSNDSAGINKKVDKDSILSTAATVQSMAGPSDWSDLFGVLHPQEKASTAPITQVVQAPPDVLCWSAEPPPLPVNTQLSCGGRETEDEFGDFLSPDDGTTTTLSSANFESNGAMAKSNCEDNDIDWSLNAISTCHTPPPIEGDCVQFGTDGCAAADYSSVGNNVSALPSSITEPLVVDKYSSIRESCGSGNSSAGSAEDCWKRCLEGCQHLLNRLMPALELLAAGSLDTDKLGNTKPVRDFLAGVLEVLLVVARVQCSARLCGSVTGSAALQDAIDAVTALQRRLEHALQHIQDPSLLLRFTGLETKLPQAPVTASQAVCSVCLTAITDAAQHGPLENTVDPCSSSQGSSLDYGGYRYHPSCANLWLNSVDLTLPTLTVSSVTLL